MMVSPSAASYFLSSDGNLLMVFKSSKMASYSFVFPTKSFSLLPKCKIRYFNFYINLPIRLESTDIYFSELWLSVKHQFCSIKKMLYCLWLFPTAVCSFLRALQLKCGTAVASWLGVCMPRWIPASQQWAWQSLMLLTGTELQKWLTWKVLCWYIHTGYAPNRWTEGDPTGFSVCNFNQFNLDMEHQA